MEKNGTAVFAALRNPGEWPASARFLVAANAVPLLMVVFAGWSLGELLALYWLESAIIGLFNVLKMLLAPSILPGAPGRQIVSGLISVVPKLFMCAFFTVHFGGFMAGHGFFLTMMMKQFKLLGENTDLPAFLLGLKWAALALVASHAYSFFVNYLGGERKSASLSGLMQQPYPRIIVMHITIIIGMFFMLLVGKSIIILALFTALKTAADLGAHLKERNRFSPPSKVDII